MEDNSFVSDQKKWIEIAYWLETRKNISKYIEAAEAVEKVNSILCSAPQDVGGGIGFKYSERYIDTLYNQWQDLCKFTEGIHYEVADLIDVPFAQKIAQLLEELYALNPRDFKTDEKFLFIPVGSSLESLLIKMTDDEKLKQSYESMIDKLNHDEIDTTLAECIAVANYWAEQFEKAEKVQTIVDNYMELHNENWKEYSEDEKLTIINNYATEIGTILNEKGDKKVRQAKIEVNWDINDPDYIKDENGDLEHGEMSDFEISGEVNGNIYINLDWANQSTTNFEAILHTVTHEVRHAYQGQAFYRQQEFNVPEEVANNWHFDKEIEPEYWSRPWEIDARGFSAISQMF